LINLSHYKINIKYIKYLLFLGWISIWASLSFNPFKIYLFFENINFKYISISDLFSLIDMSRGLFQFFYLIILIITTFILLKTKKIFFKPNIIFLLFLTILLMETLSLFKTDNPNINIFFIICSLNTILTVFLLKNFFSEADVNFVFNLSVIFLLILLIFFGYQYILTAFESGINIYGAWGNIEENLGIDTPKPTGLSRTALIIFIIFSNMSFFIKPFEKFNYLIMTLSIVLLLLLSSRTTIFIYTLYILFYIFYFRNVNLKNILIVLKKFFLIPFVIVIIISLLQNIYQFKNNQGNKIFNFKLSDISRNYPDIETSPSSEFTSGRLDDWKNILELNENIALGNGVLGDRYLINQSASNLLLYVYASSGIIGMSIIILILMITLFYTFKSIFIIKPKSSSYKFLSSIILIALMLRSILETSLGVFGIDFILFVICLSHIIPNENSYESN